MGRGSSSLINIEGFVSLSSIAILIAVSTFPSLKFNPKSLKKILDSISFIKLLIEDTVSLLLKALLSFNFISLLEEEISFRKNTDKFVFNIFLLSKFNLTLYLPDVYPKVFNSLTGSMLISLISPSLSVASGSVL